MMQATALACAADAGLKQDALKAIDAMAVVDTVGPKLVENPAAQLAQRLGIKGAAQYLTVTGGNTPQMLVNSFCADIAQGKCSMVLLSGAEALDSLSKSAKSGQTLNWKVGDDLGPPTLFSPERAGSHPTEAAHGMVAPIVTYPLFENALRKHYGRSVSEHQLVIGKMFAPYTKIAKDNPYAWFPTVRSAEEIAEPTPINRYIGFPYTKYMNAVMQVNQAASVLLTSVGKARELGIDESRWVYLHGHSDINDIWNVSERADFHSSPALELGLVSAFDMAGVSVADIGHFDVYSCFPAVVEITRDILGMSSNDKRVLTVTGGLSYFGGAGNNYSMHAIATMMERLRDHPGEWGLVTANGWYLTKHALGVYSTQPPKRPFVPQDSAELARRMDEVSHPTFDPQARGAGSIETFTVMHDRGGDPEQGLVIGRLDNGNRFVAYVPSDPSLLEQMTKEDPIGQRGYVTPGEPTNLFEFSA